jgi:hypothetical protein
MTVLRAADLPVGTIVATETMAWIKSSKAEHDLEGGSVLETRRQPTTGSRRKPSTPAPRCCGSATGVGSE